MEAISAPPARVRRAWDLRRRFEHFAIPEPNTGCWLWTGTNLNHGYTHLSYQDRLLLGHRVSYELHRGPIPAGAMVLHRCGNGHLGCVNPAHLYLGDAKQNAADAARHGVLPVGERHHATPLHDADVREIRRAHASGEAGYRALGRRYGIDKAAIARIVRRQTWRHLT